jgi:hypothetical protein
MALIGWFAPRSTHGRSALSAAVSAMRRSDASAVHRQELRGLVLSVRDLWRRLARRTDAADARQTHRQERRIQQLDVQMDATFPTPIPRRSRDCLD